MMRLTAPWKAGALPSSDLGKRAKAGGAQGPGQSSQVEADLAHVLCLEPYDFRTSHRWFELKTRLIREAVHPSPAEPGDVLSPTAWRLR